MGLDFSLICSFLVYLFRMLRMMAPSPLTGIGMLLRSMKFLLLKNLAMNTYKKGGC